MFCNHFYFDWALFYLERYSVLYLKNKKKMVHDKFKNNSQNFQKQEKKIISLWISLGDWEKTMFRFKCFNFFISLKYHVAGILIVTIIFSCNKISLSFLFSVLLVAKVLTTNLFIVCILFLTNYFFLLNNQDTINK